MRGGGGGNETAQWQRARLLMLPTWLDG